MYAANRSSGAATRASRHQMNAANQAAEIEAAAAREALAFEREREARRQKEFEMVQDRNYGLYREAQARLEPYRALGRGAIGQLMKPIPRPTTQPNPNSIGALMGGQ